MTEAHKGLPVAGQELTERCDNCEFFHAGSVITKRQNVCRRYPPQVVSLITPTGPSIHTMFPVADPDGWCGEHKLKDPTSKEAA